MIIDYEYYNSSHMRVIGITRIWQVISNSYIKNQKTLQEWDYGLFIFF